MPRQKTILLTGGGTAGHITPLLSVAKQLHEKLPQARLIYVIERNNANEELIKASGLPLEVRHIFAGKLRRFHNQKLSSQLLAIRTNLLNLRDLVYVLIGFFQSLGLVIWYRPRVVFSKGGFVSVPIGLAAVVARRRIVTHDSDAVPGLANKLVGRFAAKNAIGVHGAISSYKKDRVIFCGVPVSNEYLSRAGVPLPQLKKDIQLPEDSQVILIGGSTQGAKVIDDAVEAIVPRLLTDFPNLYIVHVFGRLNQDTMTARYINLSPELKKRLFLKTFLNDQYRYAAAADLVIYRAGATAVAEFGVLGKACVIIPAEQLTGGHQLQNAEVLEKQSAIVVVREAEVGERLEDNVRYLLQHDKQRKDLGDKLRSITPSDAAERLAEVILEVAR